MTEFNIEDFFEINFINTFKRYLHEVRGIQSEELLIRLSQTRFKINDRKSLKNIKNNGRSFN